MYVYAEPHNALGIGAGRWSPSSRQTGCTRPWPTIQSARLSTNYSTRKALPRLRIPKDVEQLDFLDVDNVNGMSLSTGLLTHNPADQ